VIGAFRGDSKCSRTSCRELVFWVVRMVVLGIVESTLMPCFVLAWLATAFDGMELLL